MFNSLFKALTADMVILLEELIKLLKITMAGGIILLLLTFLNLIVNSIRRRK